MEEVDWSSLHKILSDTTRRNIVELLAEKEELSYTEIMALLQITNTGRLNYHLKALTALLSKDNQGKYRLTERGKLAASMLKTFPERVQLVKKKQSEIKIVSAALLILLGVVLIFSAIIFAFSLPTGDVLSTGSSSSPNRVIAQNTTMFLTSVIVQTDASQLKIDWTASNPLYIYILNSTQYNGLLLQHTTNHQVPTYLENFTGVPASYVNQYYLQNGHVSVALPQGQYYLFAGSTNNAILNSLSLNMQQQQASNGSSPLEYLLPAVQGAFGILMIALGVLILNQRVWR
jgi:DNA-binding transcriptional ArsR family regulator